MNRSSSVRVGRVLIVTVAFAMGAFAVGCGGGSGQGGEAGSDTSGSMTVNAGTSEVASMAGVYTATYTGTYTANSALGSQSGSNSATATITVTDIGDGEIKATWQFGSNPPSALIDFAMTGEDGIATGVPTGGSCFQGLLDNGNTQTNCCVSCSIAFSGGTFTQPNAGTMSGVTAAGVGFTGTYDGQWVAQRQ